MRTLLTLLFIPFVVSCAADPVEVIEYDGDRDEHHRRLICTRRPELPFCQPRDTLPPPPPPDTVPEPPPPPPDTTPPPDDPPPDDPPPDDPPPDDPPPPPPPSGDCTLTVDASVGNPEDAINAATSGDVVCLTGAFDVSHTYKNAQARNGVDNILFDLRTAGVTVDGSGATVTGDFDGAQNVVLLTNAGNTRLTGFTIDVGFIIVGSGIADVVIDFNSVHRAVFPNGNAGLIRSLGGTSAGTGNLTIADNTLGDMYACNGDDCPNSGTRASWESIIDGRNFRS